MGILHIQQKWYIAVSKTNISRRYKWNWKRHIIQEHVRCSSDGGRTSSSWARYSFVKRPRKGDVRDKSVKSALSRDISARMRKNERIRQLERKRMRERERRIRQRSAYIVRFNINLISWISPSSCPLQQLYGRESYPPFLCARPASAQSAPYYVIRINFTVPKYCVRKMRSSPSSFSCADAIGIQFVDAFCIPWRKPALLQW